MGWGAGYRIKVPDDWGSGENVQDWEDGVNEANFFMRDERENKRDEKRGYGEVVLFDRLSRGDPIFYDRLVKAENGEWKIGR